MCEGNLVTPTYIKPKLMQHCNNLDCKLQILVQKAIDLWFQNP
jgi:hypothetical protein